jgi:hypothetical protein
MTFSQNGQCETNDSNWHIAAVDAFLSPNMNKCKRMRRNRLENVKNNFVATEMACVVQRIFPA